MAKLKWPKFKKKNVADCPSNNCLEPPPIIDKGKHKTEQPIPEPQKGTHMNVRDLANEPGQVMMQKKNSSERLTDTQQQRGAANEKAISKVKMIFNKRKKKS